MGLSEIGHVISWRILPPHDRRTVPHFPIPDLLSNVADAELPGFTLLLVY
jgi:hypothetical protein